MERRTGRHFKIERARRRLEPLSPAAKKQQVLNVLALVARRNPTITQGQYPARTVDNTPEERMRGI